MSFVSVITGTNAPNFLESEVGLVLKTREIPDTMGTLDGTRTIVRAGTPFPADDGTAEGIVFTDTDVTDGAMPGSVMLAGRVLKDRLTVSGDAETALTAAGIVFVDAPDITRPY